MPIYLTPIRLLLSVAFWITLRRYLKGAAFYNASHSGKLSLSECRIRRNLRESAHVRVLEKTTRRARLELYETKRRQLKQLISLGLNAAGRNPPQSSRKLLIKNRITGGGDGSRTRVRKCYWSRDYMLIRVHAPGVCRHCWQFPQDVRGPRSERTRNASR